MVTTLFNMSILFVNENILIYKKMKHRHSVIAEEASTQ